MKYNKEFTQEEIIKELQNKADLEYERLGELTFDEKYNARDKVDLRSATQRLTKLSIKEDREFTK